MLSVKVLVPGCASCDWVEKVVLEVVGPCTGGRWSARLPVLCRTGAVKTASATARRPSRRFG